MINCAFCETDFFLFFTFCFQQLFSLQPTMGKTPPGKRPDAPRRKPAMGEQANKIVRFVGKAKPYDGHNPVVNSFMTKLRWFLLIRGQTREQVVAFVQQFAKSSAVKRTLSLLIKNMERAMMVWNSQLAGNKVQVSLPWLFPNGCREGNERVPISDRRLNLLREVLKVVDETLAGGAAAPPAA